jgi:hypothetical protein
MLEEEAGNIGLWLGVPLLSAHFPGIETKALNGWLALALEEEEEDKD